MHSLIENSVYIISIYDQTYYEHRLRLLKDSLIVYSMELIDVLELSAEQDDVLITSFINKIVVTVDSATIFILGDYSLGKKAAELLSKEYNKKDPNFDINKSIAEKYTIYLYNADTIPLIESIVELLEGHYIISPYFHDYEEEKTSEFKANIQSSFGEINLPYTVLLTYQTTLFTLLSFSKSASSDVESFIEMIRTYEYDSLLGKIMFDSNNALSQRVLIGRFLSGDSTKSVTDIKLLTSGSPIFPVRLTYNQYPMKDCVWIGSNIGELVSINSISIGILISVSYIYNFDSLHIIQGAMLAVVEINESNGLKGAKLNPIVCNEGEGLKNIEDCFKLFTESDVKAIFGGKTYFL